MKTHLALIGLVFATYSCKAQSQPPQSPPSSTNTEPNTLTDAERSAGWRLLFDGTTTGGWRNYRQRTIADGWKVQDSALTRVGAGGDIITNDKFKNFELSIDWKIERGGNSGVFYRVSEEKDEIYWNAPEMQVLDDAAHPDGNDRLTSAGAAYALYPPPAGIVRPAGEWNTARLVMNGNHVEHWLNGIKLLEYELGSPEWEAKVKASKFAPHKKFGRNAEGHIGLQDHGNVVAFRNIKIRVLP